MQKKTKFYKDYNSKRALGEITKVHKNGDVSVKLNKTGQKYYDKYNALPYSLGYLPVYSKTEIRKINIEITPTFG